MAAFEALSYEQHVAHQSKWIERLPSTVGAPDSWDAWRHNRLYAAILPLIEQDRSACWMTIGDSGADALWLSQHLSNVISSSITDAQIRHLHDLGYLTGVSIEVQNAEHITKPSDSIDYVYCKEAYHHFPRPPIGLYEMLRVAKRALILCEPADAQHRRPLDLLAYWAKRILRKQGAARQLFEPTGNFIYRLSLAEVVKMATALQTGPIYYLYLSDFSFGPLCHRPRTETLAGVLIRFAIGFQMALSRLKLMSWGKIAVIIFKELPHGAIDEALVSAGYRRMDLPRNPYISPDGEPLSSFEGSNVTALHVRNGTERQQ
jgi:methyltransferase family protein